MNILKTSRPVRSIQLVSVGIAALIVTAWVPTAMAAQCMADAAGDPSLVCTANDFGISALTIDNLVDGCTGLGDTFTFNGQLSVGAGTTKRYDVGFYIGADGTQSYTGQCYVSALPITSGFANLDYDSCGDYDGSSFTLQATGVTAKCVDADQNGYYDISICTSWDNNTTPTCTGAADLAPATKSKCQCQQINTTLATPHCSTNADCPSDGNSCTDQVCNPRGSGIGDAFGCNILYNTVPCNDGRFCTQNDTCSGGTCIGLGDPCTGGAECSNVCNEAADNCNAPSGTNCSSDSNACTVDQCNGSGSCAHTAGNPGAVCRAANGVCDVQEVCTGSSTACPANGFGASGTLCRAATSACDVEEFCTGASANCPANSFAVSTTVCRAAAGVCDAQETCSGSSATCPANSFLTSANICRAAANVCDSQETCNGASANCPADSFASTSTVCRASTGVCDTQETCSGVGASCPADVLAGTGTVCRSAVGSCDVAESCSGFSNECPTDVLRAAATACRASTGICDTEELCTGSDANCPANAFAASSTVCRESAGACDLQETCSGAAAACPSDTVAGTSTVCRSTAGECDTQEVCNGTGVTCPADAFSASTTVCRSSAGICDLEETCTGSGATCPGDSFAGTTSVCRAAVGVCDLAETCNGSGAECPSDALANTAAVCRPSAGPCDVVESCDGIGSACPTDAFASSSSVCRAAAGNCDIAEVCTGAGTSCPEDAFADSSTVCRATVGDCDAAEACSGAAVNCPTDSFLGAGTACGSDGNVCTDDQCNGTGTCAHAANTVGCNDDIFCNGADTCQATSCTHAGNPCSGPDGDGNCSESCDENANSCTLPDPNGSTCNDGLFCNGGPDKCLDGVCSDHPGFPCNDSNICTDDNCNEGLGVCQFPPVANATPCDDNDICTLGDACAAGTCKGSPTGLLDLCPWVAVERLNPKRDTLKMGSSVSASGDTCGSTSKIGYASVIDGDAVSGSSSGGRAIRLAPDTLVTEDIVTAGAGVKARPGEAKLPLLLPLASSLPPGSLTPKSDASGVFDLTGTHPLADDCVKARNVYPDVMAILDGFNPPAASLPQIKLRAFATQTITAPTPGGINVIDIVQIRTGRNVVLELDGGGNAGTVMVLRIAKKLQMKLLSKVSLVGNLQPENVILYAKGKKCTFGDMAEGAGTVLCANGRLKTGRGVNWTGTLYGAGRILKIGDTNTLTYLPFLGF